MLYDRRDDRMIVVGWLATPGVARQALVLYEMAARGSTASVVAVTGNGMGNPGLDWGVSTADGAVSSCATLNPVDSNIEIFGSGGSPWYDRAVRRRILRPKGSNARTVEAYEQLNTGNDSQGAHADILHYPPNGEHHTLMRHADGWAYYWRHNRGCNFVGEGGVMARRPRFQGRNGEWVPRGARPLG
jgi:hypothetical protein